MILRNELYRIPKESGIYYLYSKRKKLVYIGKANNLFIRLKSHNKVYSETIDYMNKKIKYRPDKLEYVKPFEYIRYSLINDKNELHKKELELIHEHKPRYNYKSYIIQFPIIRRIDKDWKDLLY